MVDEGRVGGENANSGRRAEKKYEITTGLFSQRERHILGL
jgi:hypothetical protein